MDIFIYKSKIFERIIKKWIINRDFLQSLDFGDLGEFSFNFSLNSTNNLTEPLPENVPVFSTKKRRMPYLENFFTPPTNTRPTMAGVHYTQRDGLGFTIRFMDGFHSMSPSYKSKGV